MELSQKQLRDDAIAYENPTVGGYMGNNKANRYSGYRGS
jgi:hypothetical protein